MLKIGEVARQSQIGIETIRFYERQGLLAEPDRRPSGYRQYDPTVVTRLGFIRRAKELGFTLAEIRELLALWFNATTRCTHLRQRASLKVGDIEEKIRVLQQMRRSLRKIIRECESRDAKVDCPLWSGMSGSTSGETPRRKRTRKS